MIDGAGIKLADVAGIEPATPSLQIQKANVDGVKSDEKE
jgi:hypothetical protein